MKLTTTIVSLLFSSFAASTSLPFSGSQQVVINDKEKIPGDNPLVYCQDTKDYSLDIKYVDLTPNPPKP